MTRFQSYSDRFRHIHMRREDHILELRFHTDDGPMMWTPAVHEEAAEAFHMIGGDGENRVVILTGTGDMFSGPRGTDVKITAHARRPSEWEEIQTVGVELIDALLRIRAIVIGAVNGPALRHCELPLMSDIVLCSDDSEFQDSGHIPGDLTPGDGINVLTPLVMGLTRSRYFHLMAELIPATTALSRGLVNEVVPRDQLLDRAWAIARELSRNRPLVLRHTRALNTHLLRAQMHAMVPFGLALEGLDQADALGRLESGASE